MSKKFLILVLACILVLPVLLVSKEKKGVDLLVTRLDGSTVRGELIAVKANEVSLLLLSESGVDVTIATLDIQLIRIVKRSKSWQGAGLGFVVSSVSLSALAWATDDEFFTDPEGGGPLVLALFFGIPGLVVGAVVGAILGTDKKIQIAGRPEEGIREELKLLRLDARVRDIQ